MQVNQTTLVILSLREAYWYLKYRFPVPVSESFCKEILHATVISVLDNEECVYHSNATLDRALDKMESMGIEDIVAYGLLQGIYFEVSVSITDALPQFDFNGAQDYYEFSMRNDFDLIIAFYPETR